MADNDSGGMSAVVAITAIIAIVIIGYLVMRMLPAMQGTPNGGDASINVDLPDSSQGQ